MIKITIIGKDPKKIKGLKKGLIKKGYRYVDDNPEVVVCFGGDGMFLIAERVFPKIPKILIKDSEIGNKASKLSFSEALTRYAAKKYSIQKLKKLKAISKGRFEHRLMMGVNDIVIRNSLPTEAVRFQYKVNDGAWSQTIGGDGVVVATPFGSGAYFSSITRKEFTTGFAMAFNNSFKKEKPLFLNNADKITLRIVRGQAVLIGDNNRDFIGLESRDEVVIKYSKGFAKRVVFNGER